MASDSLLDVIHGLVKRDQKIAKEEDKKVKEKLKAEKAKQKAEQEPEDDEDEDEAPVGDQDEPETEVEPEAEPEVEPEAEPEVEPEAEPEAEPDDGAGDSKPNGPDPVLVQQVTNAVMGQIMQMMKDAEKEHKEANKKEIKLSGKKEKIDTQPKMESKRERKSFREAIRLSVTNGTPLSEGYEEEVLNILENEGIDGPLGYEPFFEKGKLFVEKGSEKQAAKVLKKSRDIRKVPKIVGESLEEDKKEKYQAFVSVMLKKFGVKSPAELEGDKKKAYFDALDKGWDAEGEEPEPGDKKKNENIELEKQVTKNVLKEASVDTLAVGLGVAGGLWALKKAWDKWGKTSKLAKFVNAKKYAADVVAKDKADADTADDKSQAAASDLEKKSGGSPEDAQAAFDRSVEKVGIKKAQAVSGYERHPDDDTKVIPSDEADKIRADKKKDREQDAKDMDDPDTQQSYKDKLKKKKADAEKKDKPDALSGLKKKAVDNKKNKKEGVEMTEPNIEEAYFKVDIPNMPTIYIEGGGEGSVRKSLKGSLKSDALKNIKIEKIKKGQMLKMFKAGLKEEEEVELDEEIFYWYLIKGNLEKGKVAFVGNEKQVKLKRHDRKFSGNYVMTKSRKDLKMGDKWKKSMGVSEEIDESNELQAIMALDDAGIKAEINRKGQVVIKKKDKKKAHRAFEKSFKKGGWPPLKLEDSRSAFDVVFEARSKITEAYDAHAATELKLYIDNDRDLYRKQTTSIIKNVQRKLKSGKYDHAQAPKLWSYLVDNGVKKYIKEFGGNAKDLFPKDVRQSVAIELANYYKAEIEAQGGEMM